MNRSVACLNGLAAKGGEQGMTEAIRTQEKAQGRADNSADLSCEHWLRGDHDRSAVCGEFWALSDEHWMRNRSVVETELASA